MTDAIDGPRTLPAQFSDWRQACSAMQRRCVGSRLTTKDVGKAGRW